MLRGWRVVNMLQLVELIERLMLRLQLTLWNINHWQLERINSILWWFLRFNIIVFHFFIEMAVCWEVTIVTLTWLVYMIFVVCLNLLPVVTILTRFHFCWLYESALLVIGDRASVVSKAIQIIEILARLTAVIDDLDIFLIQPVTTPICVISVPLWIEFNILDRVDMASLRDKSLFTCPQWLLIAVGITIKRSKYKTTTYQAFDLTNEVSSGLVIAFPWVLCIHWVRSPSFILCLSLKLSSLFKIEIQFFTLIIGLIILLLIK